MKKRLIKTNRNVLKVPLFLGTIWVIITSGTVLQVINLGDYVPSLLKWFLGITQLAVIAGFSWLTTKITTINEFIITQKEKNINYDESKKLVQELHDVVIELKAISKTFKNK